MNTMRIIFFGTPEFAVPALEALVKAGYKIIAVVTQPDKPAGRGLKMEAPPVKVKAMELGLKVLQPETLKSSVAEGFSLPNGGLKASATSAIQVLRALQADVGVCVAYGKIIPKKILDIFPKGVLNIHPSLLPKYRGPSPIQTVILNGDVETGVTIMLLDEEMDHGAVLSCSVYPVTQTTRGGELSEALAREGAKLLIKTIPQWLNRAIEPLTQDHATATFTKMLEREDGRIDWQKPAEQIARMVRAYDMWPGTWTTWQGKRIKILKASIEYTTPNPSSERRGNESISSPYRGEVRRGGSEANTITVNCNPGAIILEQIQPEGKKVMTAENFLRGSPKFLGSILN